MTTSNAWLLPSQTTNDAGSFATLANYFTASDDFDVDAIIASFNAAGVGNVYSAFIATIDGSQNINGLVATANTRFTTVASGFQTRAFDIPKVTLANGSSYCVGLVITSGTGTTACRLGNGQVAYNLAAPVSGVIVPAMPLSSPGRVWFAQNSDAPTSVTKASSSTSGLYTIGLRLPATPSGGLLAHPGLSGGMAA